MIDPESLGERGKGVNSKKGGGVKMAPGKRGGLKPNWGANTRRRRGQSRIWIRKTGRNIK